MLQAEALITGSYSPYNDSGDKMDVNVRVVTIEKGKILAGSRQSKIAVPVTSHRNVNAKLGNLNPMFQQLLNSIDPDKSPGSKDAPVAIEGVPVSASAENIFTSASFKKCVNIYSTSISAHQAADACFRFGDSFSFADNPSFNECYAVYSISKPAHEAAGICVDKIRGAAK